jgi:hypothetical protein
MTADYNPTPVINKIVSQAVGRSGKFAPFEGDTIERVNQKRLSKAAECKEKLEALIPEINRMDTKIAEIAGELYRKNEKFKELGEPNHHKPPINPIVFGLVMWIIAPFLEMPLNAASLDFLKLPEAESFMLSAFFAIINVFGAKSSARVLRQAELKWELDWHILKVWLVFACFNVAFLLVISDLGNLRGMLAQANSQLNASSGQMFFHLQAVFYVAGIFISFQQINPSEVYEQLHHRIESLRRQRHKDWARRVHLAQKYNKTLEIGECDIKRLERWCLSCLFEYRDGNMFSRDTSPPLYWQQPLSDDIFFPIDLGSKIDPNPDSIDAVLQADR